MSTARPAGGGAAAGAGSGGASAGSTHSSVREAASGKLKGMPSFAERKAGRGRFVVASLVVATGAAALLTSYVVNGRGMPVPTVPYEKDKDQTHHPEGPLIKDAPKKVVAGSAVMGHNEGLKGVIPESINISRDRG